MPRTPRTSRDGTPDRVLAAALDLFNERGTAAVTTNHIAERAGLSPGNLYYWFANKGEIVRALYDRFADAHLAVWAADDLTQGPAALAAGITRATGVTTRYAFLGRELLALVHADPVLAERYRAVRSARLARFTAVARQWRATGLLLSRDGAPPTDATLDAVVHALWVVSETWLPFAEMDGAATPEQGARILGAIVEPWLAPTAGQEEPT